MHNIKGKVHEASGTYPTVDLEAIYKFRDRYRLKFKFQDEGGDLGGQLGLGYTF